MLRTAIPIQKAFDIARDKTSDAKCRRALTEVADAIRRGEEVSSVMQEQRGAFPDLMIEMVTVAEQTGAMPEILEGLADHYDNLVRLRKDLVGSLIWPVFQFVAATLVIALLIFILGWIADSRGGQPIDILGFGLSGGKGAILWLCMVFGTVLSLFVLYKIVASGLSGKKFLDGFLLQIPIIGGCLQSFAIARFSWSFYLTQQTGMPIAQSLETSLRATNNGAFQAASPQICQMVNSGTTLTKALSASRLFPADFLAMVEVAEESGTVPEALDRLSPQFADQARRSLARLTSALGWVIWSCVAIFIIFLIFRIAFFYVGMINNATREALG
ncbi:MAG: type II secretion system F family protein [Planctomycetaceae bacterium]